MRPLLLALIACATVLPHAAVRAQGVGHAPTVLLVPAGTRAVGLGDAFVAGDGPEVLFSNPAQIGSGGSTISLARFGRSATLGSLASAGRLAGHTVAIGVRFLDYGPDGFPEPVGLLPARGPSDGTSLDAMVAVEQQWYGVKFGGAFHYVSEQQAAGRANGALFDLGASRRVLGVMFGAAVRNLGPTLELGGIRATTPLSVAVGAMREGMRVGTFFDLGLAAAVTRERGGRIVPGAGAELTWEPVAGWTVTGRAGVRRPGPAGLPGPSAASFGASFGLDGLSLDYAFQPWRGVTGAVHRIGLRIQ